MEKKEGKDIYHITRSPKELTPISFDRYLARGWFRMKQDIFTSTHNLYEEGSTDTIKRVWWLRYNINEFELQSSQRRLLKKIKQFNISIDKFEDNSDEEHELYERYRKSINFDGYESLFSYLYKRVKSKSIYNSHIIRIRDGNKLIAAGIFDVGMKAAASGLHFFDPSYSKYSLGRAMMLITIEYMMQNDMAWYYPGYIIVGKPKLNYKLFLGEDRAKYYDFKTRSWLNYHPSILKEEEYSDEQIERFMLAYLISSIGN